MPKTPKRRLTSKERAQVFTLRDVGWTQQQIAKHFGIPQTTVSLCLRTQCTPEKPKGRPPILTTPLRQTLVTNATKNAEQRRKPWSQVAEESGFHLCYRTLHKAFHKEFYFRRKATSKPFLTDTHQRERLKWAHEHVCWTDDQWNSVHWTDEMSILAGGGEIFVTRRAEEKYHPSCMSAKFKGYSNWMVWGLIAYNYKGPFVVFEKEWNNGHVNSEVYIRYILPKME